MVTSDQRPGDIRDYTVVRDTPLVLGALLVVLAVGTLAHVLLTGVRRRRRDLAVLKTLGLSRGQVLRLVAWQAGAFGFVALLVGLPLGVLAGRLAWAAFAATAGIAPSPDIPLALILLTIPATLLIAMLIAVWPGWRAARLRPAAVLRRSDGGTTLPGMAAVLPPGWGGDGMLAMTTIWLTLRADVRRRWRTLVGLAVLLGLIGGVVLTAAAGARRTDTAYPGCCSGPTRPARDHGPRHRAHRVLHGAGPAAADRGDVDRPGLVPAAVLAPRDRRAGSRCGLLQPRPRPGVSAQPGQGLAGQLFNPKAPGQAMIDPRLASLEHLPPGGTLRLLRVPSTPTASPNTAGPSR